MEKESVKKIDKKYVADKAEISVKKDIWEYEDGCNKNLMKD